MVDSRSWDDIIYDDKEEEGIEERSVQVFCLSAKSCRSSNTRPDSLSEG